MWAFVCSAIDASLAAEDGWEGADVHVEVFVFLAVCGRADAGAVHGFGACEEVFGDGVLASFGVACDGFERVVEADVLFDALPDPEEDGEGDE